MTRRSSSLPHTGIATFAKAPYVEDISGLEADIGILGVPTDSAAGMRPGCRQAPRAIRDASTRFGFIGQGDGRGYVDINTRQRRLEGIRVADCGDADVTVYDAEQNVGIIESTVRQILVQRAMPLVIGGDHSISYPVIRAFENFAPLTVVLFDAHLDYRDVVQGQRLTNNSPFRRAQELPWVTQIITIGVRGIKSTDRELRETLDRGNLVFTNYQVFDEGVRGILDQLPRDLGHYYVSIDIDVLDPSLAPGTESPEAEGLSYTHVKRLLQGIAPRGQMAGLDLVEVNPYLDHAELTQHIAAQLLIEAMATRHELP
ncbi:MAG: agmatinase [Vicinamibacterales bacterium]